MKFQILTFLLFFNFLHGMTVKYFHLGRSFGGNLGTPPTTHSVNDISDKWFVQPLDHFDPTETRVWKQRYMVNSDFYDKNVGGPIFLQISGEAEMSGQWMKNGSWIDYAKQFGALCFQVEHRYYGKSHPTEDLSVKNLKYLNSEQALFDLASFISGMNDLYKINNPKWIAFGGSYAGSLAAWLRLKFPHLVVGAMSASGPLLAQADFIDYFKVVEEDLRIESEECVQAVKRGTELISVLMRHMIGLRSINDKFHLCDPIENSVGNDKDISNLFDSLSGNFAEIAQYNKDNRMGRSAIFNNITLTGLCTIMTNGSIGTELDRLAAVNELMLKVNEQKCLDYKYDNLMKSLTNTSWDSTSSEGGRQWTYQTCTEFGFYQTSSMKKNIFGDKIPLSFFIQQCVDVFGPKFNEDLLNKGIDRTNTNYGELNIDVSNVVFVHGSVDPWHALGVTKTKENNAPAIYIPGTAHCANMYPKSVNDAPELQEARVEIMQHIDSWLRLS